jgi:hypothetical protein
LSQEPVTAIELSGTGVLTLKAKPKLIVHIPRTLELCEPGGKCKIVGFECAYGISKLTGQFHVPGFIEEVATGAVGKLSAKESDSRCAKTQAFQTFVTLFTTDTTLWTEL